jgi:hypothetical protein
MGSKFLLILISILLGTMVRAQTEIMRVYTDQNVYLAGEKIWVAGIKPGADDGIGSLVRAYLFDRAGNVVQKSRVTDAGGKFSLALQLEGSLFTDHYLLAVSSKGYQTVFLPVAVISPVIPPVQASVVKELAPANDRRPLRIKTNKMEYLKREEAVIEADEVKDADFHIRVSRRDELSRYIDSGLAPWRNNGLSIIEADPVEGEQIMLSVYDVSNEPAKGVRVFASVLGDQANIATTITDEHGKAIMTLPYVYGNASLAFSAPGGAYRIVYEEASVRVKGEMSLPPLSLEDRFRESINQRLLNAEVTNKYRPDSKTGYVLSALDTTDFYGKPDKRYMLDDYTRIPNMEEILYEYVLEARARKLGDKSVIYAFNTPFKTFFELPAMVLLDGVPVSDIDQLLSMDPLKLRSVDVIAKKFLLDDLQIPGIVHYKSYKSDMADFKLPPGDVVQTIQGLSIPVKPVFAPYGAGNSERLPDMRNLAYWSAFSKQRQWKFLAPDNEGEYLVTVLAVDAAGNEFRSEVVVIIK